MSWGNKEGYNTLVETTYGNLDRYIGMENWKMFSNHLHIDLETMIRMESEEVSVLAINCTAQAYCHIASKLLMWVHLKILLNWEIV